MRPGGDHGDKKNARIVSLADNKKSDVKKDKKEHARTTAQSGNEKPGWGYGDKNHVHTGPPGQSVRVDNHVNASTAINIMAEAGAKIVVNIVNNITQIFHINA